MTIVLRDRNKAKRDGIPVRLTRKHSEVIDDVDLSQSKVGDRLRLSERDARMLIAEGWAMPCDDEPPPTKSPGKKRPAGER